MIALLGPRTTTTRIQPLPAFRAGSQQRITAAADQFVLRFSGVEKAHAAKLSAEEKKALIAQAPVEFVGGADYRKLAKTRRAAENAIRRVAVHAFKSAEVANHPTIKGALPEAFGAAALVQTSSNSRGKIRHGININFEPDDKRCAEQNLLMEVLKEYRDDSPSIRVMANMLYNFDSERYHGCNLTPCNACLKTFRTQLVNGRAPLSPDTLITSAVVSKNTQGELALKLVVRPVRAFFPKLLGELGESFPALKSGLPIQQQVQAMPVAYSEAAWSLIKQRRHAPLTDAHIRDILVETYAQVAVSALAETSERNKEYAAVGLMTYPDAVGTLPVSAAGNNTLIKNSELQHAEDNAVNNLRMQLLRQRGFTLDPSDIEARTRPDEDAHLRDKKKLAPLAGDLAIAAYVHRQTNLPTPREFGRLKDASGGKDFLVAMFEKGKRIRVYTASELLPIQYKAPLPTVL